MRSVVRALAWYAHVPGLPPSTGRGVVVVQNS